MTMKNLYIIFISILILLCASCGKYDQRIEVSDLQNPQVIKLHKKQSQKYINAMRIRGTGKLNGEANIVLMLNDKPYKKANLNGNVSFNWGADWYSDDMEIRYQPVKVDSGTILIEYSFID